MTMHDEPTEYEWVNRPDGSISYAVNGYPDGTFDVSIYGAPGQGVVEYSPRFESIDEAYEWAATALASNPTNRTTT